VNVSRAYYERRRVVFRGDIWHRFAWLDTQSDYQHITRDGPMLIAAGLHVAIGSSAILVTSLDLAMASLLYGCDPVV
jgi:hypothetical protein